MQRGTGALRRAVFSQEKNTIDRDMLCVGWLLTRCGKANCEALCGAFASLACAAGGRREARAGLRSSQEARPHRVCIWERACMWRVLHQNARSLYH